MICCYSPLGALEHDSLLVKNICRIASISRFTPFIKNSHLIFIINYYSWLAFEAFERLEKMMEKVSYKTGLNPVRVDMLGL